MGTEITLDFEGLSLSYSKNYRGIDHGALFQEGDRKPVRSEQIDYDYFREHGEDPRPMEMAFTRPLRTVIPRLDLLGYTLANAQAAYDRWVRTWKDDQEHLRDVAPGSPHVDPLSFAEFVAFVGKHPVYELDDSFVDYDDQKREGVPKGRFIGDDALVERIPKGVDHDDLAWSERSYFGSVINVLDAYFMLQIFAQNPANLESDVVWQYGPLVRNGWAQTSEFFGLARRRETYLIATEGSSDAHILQHALALLRPEILDFFRFIDVSERHPFSGTGNLVKFAEGLAKIDVHNQTIFVFDNDAEGVDAFQKVRGLSLPANMKAMVLPHLDEFTAFPARGPEGEHMAEINGRAAAIECYLDHRLKDYPAPRVRWTNFKAEMQTYQGALEHKESYAKAFLRLKPDGVGDYDTAKLATVLEAVVAECVSMAGADLAERFELSGD